MPGGIFLPGSLVLDVVLRGCCQPSPMIVAASFLVMVWWTRRTETACGGTVVVFTLPFAE